MSVYLDSQYMMQLSTRLRNFKRKRDALWNFSCPICGDSKKDKSKARGFVFRKGNQLFFKCHNCNAGLNFANFLKQVDNSLYDQYLTDRYKSGDNKNLKTTELNRVMNIKPVQFKPKHEILDGLPRISGLEPEHPARVYVESRKIPESLWREIFWTDDFRSLAMRFDQKYAKLKENDGRIVFPFIDNNDSVIAAQGRTLNPDDKIRYITVKASDDATKVFGLNKVNITKPILVVEGTIDSLFLPNCIAAACSDLRIVGEFVPKDKCVLIPDREPRNQQICQLISRCIKEGWRVCLFPDSLKSKDINDYILKDGKSQDEIVDLIKKHSYSGLEAELEFSQWRKCNV